ncbi:PAS domain-containing protein [Rhizobium paknamense]|uniref:PAS domain-containing protein n=1 Tax=Rhizobium paknamense TaxID=1206817 RepID=A0ABU0I8A9_9HYPH|nr:PAS domain-containing protein [Rhizobium paknamense]MDQ0454458.1 PAS domain-containing protein [Rhizobium paknamense]
MSFIIQEINHRLPEACDTMGLTEKDVMDLVQTFQLCGFWRIDIDRGHFFATENFYRLFEVEPQSGPLNIKALAERIHPDDRDMLLETYQRACSTGETYQNIHRLITRCGCTKFIRVIGRFRATGQGSGELQGIIHEILPQVPTATFLRKADGEPSDAVRA